jgi:hypothetical protein
MIIIAGRGAKGRYSFAPRGNEKNKTCQVIVRTHIFPFIFNDLLCMGLLAVNTPSHKRSARDNNLKQQVTQLGLNF